jgi:hypothetical protein
MTIPCKTCERPGSCIGDRRCNRPRTVDHALKEWAAAIDAMNAAATRLNDASKAVQEALKTEAQP